ncbi:MAG: hypothetical protein ABW168_25145 [Sedimenticola sp.]
MARKKMTLDQRSVNSKSEAMAPAPAAAEEPTKRITVDLPASLYRPLEIKAADEEMTMSRLLRVWLEEKAE